MKKQTNKTVKEQYDWKHCRIKQCHSHQINAQKAVGNIWMLPNRTAFQQFKGKYEVKESSDRQ